MLKAQDYKESDKIIWLYSEKLGKISAIVHGAKKNKSKLFSLALPFCYGEYILFRGKSMYTINEGQIIDSFQCFLNSLDSLTYASYLCELLELSQTEEESSRELFKELVSTFYMMKNGVANFEILSRYFEIQLLAYSGYKLNLSRCTVCGRPIEVSDYFNLRYNGGVCKNCDKTFGIPISNATFSALRYFSNSTILNVCKLSLSSKILSELEMVLSSIIYQTFSKKPNSLEMIKLLRSDTNE